MKCPTLIAKLVLLDSTTDHKTDSMIRKRTFQRITFQYKTLPTCSFKFLFAMIHCVKFVYGILSVFMFSVSGSLLEFVCCLICGGRGNLKAGTRSSWWVVSIESIFLNLGSGEVSLPAAAVDWLLVVCLLVLIETVAGGTAQLADLFDFI